MESPAPTPSTPLETDPILATSTTTPFHLSVTRTWGNRTLPVKSPEWRALRDKILTRDNRTCASCGYRSPHPAGRGLKIDHRDGNASNNDETNLRVHCPPCEATRHCGFAGMKGWLLLGRSGMEQVEIIRRTREIFEESGRIPRMIEVDPHAFPVEMTAVDLANKLLDTEWENLPEEERGLRGFFARKADELFLITAKTPELGEVNPSDAEADRILAIESSRPWIAYSPESHKTLSDFLSAWPPSSTPQTQVAWICIGRARPQPPPSSTKPNEPGLLLAWEDLCASRRPTVSDLDDLARRFGIRTGKWLVFSESANIDALWARIARATHAGTLGSSAKVSPRTEDSKHVVCVYTQDYMNVADVRKVRAGLMRLGVKEKIKYKPDVYTHCRVYSRNAWGIPPSKYYD